MWTAAQRNNAFQFWITCRSNWCCMQSSPVLQSFHVMAQYTLFIFLVAALLINTLCYCTLLRMCTVSHPLPCTLCSSCSHNSIYCATLWGGLGVPNLIKPLYVRNNSNNSCFSCLALLFTRPMWEFVHAGHSIRCMNWVVVIKYYFAYCLLTATSILKLHSPVQAVPQWVSILEVC